MWKYSVGILINSWPLPQPILISLLSEEGDFFVLYKLTLLLSTHYQLSIPFHISSILSFLALVSWHKKNKLKSLPWKTKPNSPDTLYLAISVLFFLSFATKYLERTVSLASLPLFFYSFPVIWSFCQNSTANAPTEVTSELHVRIIGWFSAWV